MTEFQNPGFTIVGDHLAQHPDLSFCAIGLATYIQSLPEGAPVDIRTLAARFPEGRERIAAAMRELEAHGYIERRRMRTPEGKIVTRTISYNNPEATRARLAREAAAAQGARPGQGQSQGGEPAPEEPEPARPPVAPDVLPAPTPTTAARHTPPATAADAPPVPPAPAPASAPAPAPAREPAVRETPVRETPSPPLPQAAAHDLDRRRAAADLLAGLRRDDPRLLLSERDVQRLAPGVEAWLERGTTPYAVRHALTAALPPDLRHPAALLAHRLTALLPPPLLPSPPLQAAPPVGAVTAPRPHPLQNCDRCDRAYRAPEPGTCRGCTAAVAAQGGHVQAA
ncbi:hypothetical protein [Streptomyces sp. NPDC093109]|uniref:hypothetical protein n=1 Tax=Streptomyces sp. NPDC093109 TaxID=3154977 RepID=UPI0034501D93